MASSWDSISYIYIHIYNEKQKILLSVLTSHQSVFQMIDDV